MSEAGKRAKALLDKKLAEESSLFSRFRKKTGSSSADEFFSGLVEGAFLLAAADGDLSEDEEMTLSETLREITGNMYEPEEFMEMLHSFEEALREDGREVRLKTLAGSLPDEAARRAVLSFAVLVALCDRHLADSENSLLQAMGSAFGFQQDAVDAVINEARKELELEWKLACFLAITAPCFGRAEVASYWKRSQPVRGAVGRRTSPVVRVNEAAIQGW